MKALFSVDSLDGSKESIERYSLQDALKKKFDTVFYINGSYPRKENRSIYFSIIREINRKTRLKHINNIHERLLRKHEQSLLNEVSSNKFDLFISVNQFHSKEFISLLKKENNKIVTVLFLWDKLETTELKKTISEYDFVFSFDPVDCEKYGFIFRPSFFVPQKNEGILTKKNIDVYYLGKFKDNERYKYITSLYDVCEGIGVSSHLRLYVDKKNIKNAPFHPVITNKKVSYIENIKMAKKAKVIIELNIENQTGLTLRSLECLSSKSKLITNNRHIINYDFYDENNIFIINSTDDIHRIPHDFFTSPYKNPDPTIISRYSPSGFIDEIISIIGIN